MYEGVNLKRCTHCKEMKDRSEFYRCRSRSDGLNNKCKACAAELIRADRLKHGEKRKAAFKRWADQNRERLNERERIRQLTKRGMCLVAYARCRARRKRVPFDLDQHIAEIQRRVDVGLCELTGLPLNLSGGLVWNSPSIDRIVPELGYVLGNVRIICRAMNAALGDWGEEVLIRMVGAMQSVRKQGQRSSGRSLRSKQTRSD